MPVAGDNWYQRGRKDAEGDYFRTVAKGAQGMFVCTASGKVLGSTNNQDADSVRRVINEALVKWKALPDDERRPDGVKVPALGAIDASVPQPPKGGLILRVHTRILDRDAKSGDLCKGTCKTPGGDFAGRDNCWVTEAEWRALLPAKLAIGEKADVPAALLRRIALHHLVDNTRGEPTMWADVQLRQKKARVVVEAVTDAEVRLRLEGSVVLASAADAKTADRGFDVHLLGYLRFDRSKKQFERFDVLAVGDHWGQLGHLMPLGREGKSLLGIAFELGSATNPVDNIPPMGARDAGSYLGTGR